AGGLAIGAPLVAVAAPAIDLMLRVAPSPETLSPSARVGDGANAAPSPIVPTEVPSVSPAAASAATAVISAAELSHRLAGLDPRGSARTAAAAVIAAWGGRPLGGGETRLPEGLESVAWRRGPEGREFPAKRSTPRLPDLPSLPALR